MTREINLGNLIIPLIKPQKGIDYYTPAEKQEIVNEVTNNVNDVILPQEEIRQSNEITRQNNENTRQAQETSRTISENERQNNESSRESAEQERTETFNTQMQAVNTAIQGIHTSQEAYDQNAQEKTTVFNTNATNKMNAYNTNATEKIAEYDAHVHDYEQELANKVDKVAGKVLSTNDFTNEKSQQIETNKTAIQTNAGAITDLSGRVTEVEGDTVDIQEEQAEQNESITENKTNIDKLKSENETLKSIINQQPQVSGEGESVTLNNTIKAPFTLFSPEGHSEQESTSISGGDEYDSPSPEHEQPIKSAGENVNLFDKENANILNVIINDTSVLESTNGRSLYIPITGGKTYTIFKRTSERFRVGTTTTQPTIGTSISNYISEDNRNNYITINTSSSANYLVIYYYLYNTDTLTEQQILDSIKIVEGTYVGEYSPYGMGSITDKIVNRNWLLNGKAFTPNAGGWYDQLGTVTTSLSQINLNTNYYDLKANTNYTIKIDKYKNINAYQLAFIKNNVINAMVKTTNLANPVTFKPTENMRVWLRAQIVETNVETYFDAQLELGSTANPYVPHEEQTYSIYTQQPFRSIGDVRDGFVKINGVWNEKHLPYIASYNGEELPQDVYNEVGGIKYCNDKSMSTTGQFSTGASVQYIDESNWTYIPCTQSQIDILENIPFTFAGQTNVFSIDEVKAYLRAKGLKDLNTLDSEINNVKQAIVALGGVV